MFQAHKLSIRRYRVTRPFYLFSKMLSRDKKRRREAICGFFELQIAFTLFNKAMRQFVRQRESPTLDTQLGADHDYGTSGSPPAVAHRP